MSKVNHYLIMRHYFDFAFANPDKIKPEHAAILFYIIDLNNRLAWKEKFTLPTYTAMEALGIKRHQTFSKYLSDLIEWGYVIMVKKSLNQHIANVISLNSAMLKNDIADVKAHDKALLMHAPKHCEGTVTIDRLSKNIETVKENKDNENMSLPPGESAKNENGSSSEYKQSILKDCIPEFVAAIAPEYYTSGQIPKIDKYLIEKGCYTKMFSNDQSFMEKLQKYYPIERPEQVRKMLIQFLSSQDLHCNDKGYWKGWADLKNNFFNWHSKIAQTPKRKGLMG
jgi:hypothetical protein